MLWDNPKICSGRGLRRRAASTPRSRPGVVVVLLVGAAFLSACATQVPRREALAGYGRAAERGQGASWESVMATPEVAEGLGDTDPSERAEFARADGRLSIESNGPILASGAWPQPYRADLDTPRYLYIRDRNGTFTFFGVRPRYGDLHDGYRRDYRRGWDGW